MKIILIILLSFISFESFAQYFQESKNLNIKAKEIDIATDKNITFLENVLINSNYVSINADSAEYHKNEKSITIKGLPTTIHSTEKNRSFFGSADKIIFYSDERIHLVGNASITHNKIIISSNKIVLNSTNGSFTSE